MFFVVNVFVVVGESLEQNRGVHRQHDTLPKVREARLIKKKKNLLFAC